MIPRPVLPRLNRENIKRFVDDYFVKDDSTLHKGMTAKKREFIGISQVKAWNKQEFLPIVQWNILKDDYSELRVLQGFLEVWKTSGDSGNKKPFETEVVASNTISRIDGTVSQEGGGLFQREKTWYREGSVLDLYVEVNSAELTSLVQGFLADYLPKTGFGADKSIGMGGLDISVDEAFVPDQIAASNSNARLSLSFASFPGIEGYKAYYRLITKFGKLGGTFAFSSPTGGNPKPFKKPILMYAPGATFLCKESLSNKPLMKNVHSDQQIRHCGIPLTLPFKISEDIFYGIKA
jgi:CRISPR-associated protein Csm4